ncbi:MAG: serine/threonine-protein kinase [Myxococcota bacterium]
MAARPSSLGKYTLVRRLGDGGMAQVYLAHTGGLGRAQREVALKVMHPHLVDRPEITSLFFREALVASTLDHPNLVTVLDSGQHQGRCFLAMEFVPGLDLRRLLRAVWSRDEQLPVGVVVAITVAMCAGLHHAHERCDGQGRSLGIVHRDVSPSNVLLSRDGAVKVGDLGVAKAVDSWTAMHSATGTIRGKLGYMAPEQARGG